MSLQLPLRLFCCLGIILMLEAPGAGQETLPAPEEVSPPVVMEFAPPLDLVDCRQVKVDITEVLLNENATGLTAASSGLAQWSVVEVDDETAETTMRMKLANLAQRIMGQDLDSHPPPPILLRVDLCAQLVDRPNAEATPKQPAGEILSQGGLPLQTLAVLCALPQLPDHPVAVGESWEHTLVYQLPGFGKVQLEIETVLKDVADNVAQLESHLQAHLPDFEADNPLMPGQVVEISQAVIQLTEFVQEYDLDLCLVRRAGGKANATFKATGPDMCFPVKLIANLTYAEVPSPPEDL